MRDRARSGILVAIAIMLAAPAPARAQPGRTWRVVGETNFGVRFNQGGLVDYGFRLVLLAGITTRAVDVHVAIDRQIGRTNHIPDGQGHEALWSEWTASFRAGHRFRLAPGLWFLATGGMALIHVSADGEIPGTPRTREVTRSNLGVDTVIAVVRRSGVISASLVAGATFVPFRQELPIIDAYFAMPGRVEPWGGLSAGLVF